MRPYYPRKSRGNLYPNPQSDRAKYIYFRKDKIDNPYTAYLRTGLIPFAVTQGKVFSNLNDAVAWLDSL